MPNATGYDLGVSARRAKSARLGFLLLFCFLSICHAQTPSPPEYDKALKQAQDMQAQGDLEGAIKTLGLWVEKYPDQPQGQHLLGLAYYQKQDWGSAIRHLTAALKLEAENSAAWKQAAETLAMAYYFSNRVQDAVPLLEKAVTWNPGDTYFLYALAMSYVYVRDLESANRAFARLFGIPPDRPEALVLTSHFLAREKFVAEAQKLILEAQKKRPDLPDLNYRLALMALTNGALPEAVKHLEKELAGNPAHPMAWHYLGDIYVRQGKWDEAIRCLQRAIWLNLRSTESYIVIANAYAQQGKHQEAEQALKRALALAPQNYEARFLLARIYHKTNRPELARREMELANRLRAESEARQ